MANNKLHKKNLSEKINELVNKYNITDSNLLYLAYSHLGKGKFSDREIKADILIKRNQEYFNKVYENQDSRSEFVFSLYNLIDKQKNSLEKRRKKYEEKTLENKLNSIENSYNFFDDDLKICDILLGKSKGKYLNNFSNRLNEVNNLISTKSLVLSKGKSNYEILEKYTSYLNQIYNVIYDHNKNLNKKRKYPEAVKNQFSKFNENINNLEKITGKIRDYNQPSTKRQSVIFLNPLNNQENKLYGSYLDDIKQKYNKPILKDNSPIPLNKKGYEYYLNYVRDKYRNHIIETITSKNEFNFKEIYNSLISKVKFSFNSFYHTLAKANFL